MTSLLKNELKIKLKKILENPEIGKTMRYARKGTRELYIGSFRLSYVYLKSENKIIFLDLYHKDEQ
ncbi:mRNA-degrading endonuclease RelE, toxin component of the RelBE toxin-antitoxin system [Candidatus Methanophagaceae archaeon]|nr:mRNA-degrading endonuclease RelE, toxin component of the RelBE toxin-antitoxin system [Methanophagales archaeon]